MNMDDKTGSCIPGISMSDVMMAGGLELAQSVDRLHDASFQARVAYWKAHSAADLKTACQTPKAHITGNKSVLALRLAVKDLPAVVPSEPPVSSKAAGKRKAADPAAEPKEPKAPKTPKAPNELAGLKSTKEELKAANPDDLAAIKTADVKKALNAHVKSLAHTVNRDWHDSYEETAEEACEWFKKCGDIVESVLRVGVVNGVALDVCHEALKQISDTWSNINAIPFRGNVGDDVSNVDESISVYLGGDEIAEYTLTSPEALLQLAWPCLLARAAANPSVPDAALLRMFKDAIDHGVEDPMDESEEEAELAATMNGVEGDDGEEDRAELCCAEIDEGRARLGALANSRKAEWMALPSTKKEHKMRNAIDRRFSGSKHLRTRDFSDAFW